VIAVEVVGEAVAVVVGAAVVVAAAIAIEVEAVTVIDVVIVMMIVIEGDIPVVVVAVVNILIVNDCLRPPLPPRHPLRRHTIAIVHRAVIARNESKPNPIHLTININSYNPKSNLNNNSQINSNRSRRASASLRR
jgi:hypothetical protein